MKNTFVFFVVNIAYHFPSNIVYFFKNIKQFLRKGDCLVLNNTRVIPARLYGEKEEKAPNSIHRKL